MTDFLLDTHTFLWSLTGNGLSTTARDAFLERDNNLLFSAASYWEICIKQSLGKLKLAANWFDGFDEEMRVNTIRWLPIEKTHCLKLLDLPRIHGDPFDRLLIAQALAEDLTILTADRHIQMYSVLTLW